MASASDNFNRADGSLGANWTVLVGSVSILSNQAKAGVATDCLAYYNAVTPSTTFQKSQIRSTAAINFYGPAVCISAGPNYYAYFNDGTIQRCVGGTRVVILTGAPTFTTADVVIVVRSGISVHAVKNGVLVASVEDTLLTTGTFGFIFTSSASAVLDDWAGDDIPPLSEEWVTHLNAEVSESGDSTPNENRLTHLNAESMEDGDDTPNAEWLTHLAVEVMFNNQVIVPTPSDATGVYFIDPRRTPNYDNYYDTPRKIPNPTIRTALIGD